MMDLFINGRWKKRITLTVVDSGNWPFDPERAVHVNNVIADWLNYVYDLDIVSDPTIYSEIPDDGNRISTYYVPQIELDVRIGAPGFLATSGRDMDQAEIIGGYVAYGTNCNLLEKFAGIHFHEILHCLGCKHWNQSLSIMNGYPGPYISYLWQALPKALDFRFLDQLIPGPWVKAHPSAYDYGDLSGNRAIIHVPAIDIWGAYQAIHFHAFNSGGQWILEANRSEISVVPYIKPVATYQDGKLDIPLRYDGACILIKATEQQNTPSSKLRFIVDDILPDFVERRNGHIIGP